MKKSAHPKRKKSFFRLRMISVSTLVCFVFSGIIWPPSYSYADFANSIPPLAETKDFSNLQIPSEMGSMKERFSPAEMTGKPLIVYIQDAHAVYDAQKSIQGIINYLQKEFSLPLVAIEGAAGELDPVLFRAFPDAAVKAKVFDELMHKGEISGADAAAILNPSWSDFVGIEDTTLYMEDRDAFIEAIRKKEEASKILDQKLLENSEQKNRFYSQELLELDRKFEAFQDHPQELIHLLNLLTRYPLSETRFPKLHLILMEVSRQARKDSKEGEHNVPIMKLAGRLKSQLRGQELKEYGSAYQAFQKEGARDEFVEFLWRKAREKGVEVSDFKRTLRQERKNAKLKTTGGDEIFQELEIFMREKKEELFRSPQERELNDAARQLKLLQKLIALELTREELQEITTMTSEAKRSINEFLTPALHFYELALARDRVLFEKLIEEVKKNRVPLAAVVTGGFHAEGIKALLKENGYPYVLIAPKIHEVGESPYLDVMLGKNLSYEKHLKTGNSIEHSQIALMDLIAPQIIGQDKWDAIQKSWSEKMTERVIKENQDASIENLLQQWHDAIVTILLETRSDKNSAQYEGNIRAIHDQFVSALPKVNGVDEQKKTIGQIVNALQEFFQEYIQGKRIKAEAFLNQMSQGRLDQAFKELGYQKPLEEVTALVNPVKVFGSLAENLNKKYSPEDLAVAQEIVSGISLKNMQDAIIRGQDFVNRVTSTGEVKELSPDATHTNQARSKLEEAIKGAYAGYDVLSQDQKDALIFAASQAVVAGAEKKFLAQQFSINERVSGAGESQDIKGPLQLSTGSQLQPIQSSSSPFSHHVDGNHTLETDALPSPFQAGSLPEASLEVNKKMINSDISNPPTSARAEVRQGNVDEQAQPKVWTIEGYQFKPVPQDEINAFDTNLVDMESGFTDLIKHHKEQIIEDFKERNVSHSQPISLHVSEDEENGTIIFKLRGQTETGEVREAEIIINSFNENLVEYKSYAKQKINLDRVVNALEAFGGIREVFKGHAVIDRNGSVKAEDVTPQNLKDQGIQMVNLTALDKDGNPMTTVKLQIQEGGGFKILKSKRETLLEEKAKEFKYQTRLHQAAIYIPAYAPESVIAPAPSAYHLVDDVLLDSQSAETTTAEAKAVTPAPVVGSAFSSSAFPVSYATTAATNETVAPDAKQPIDVMANPDARAVILAVAEAWYSDMHRSPPFASATPQDLKQNAARGIKVKEFSAGRDNLALIGLPYGNVSVPLSGSLWKLPLPEIDAQLAQLDTPEKLEAFLKQHYPNFSPRPQEQKEPVAVEPVEEVPWTEVKGFPLKARLLSYPNGTQVTEYADLKGNSVLMIPGDFRNFNSGLGASFVTGEGRNTSVQTSLFTVHILIRNDGSIFINNLERKEQADGVSISLTNKEDTTTQVRIQLGGFSLEATTLQGPIKKVTNFISSPDGILVEAEDDEGGFRSLRIPNFESWEEFKSFKEAVIKRNKNSNDPELNTKVYQAKTMAQRKMAQEMVKLMREATGARSEVRSDQEKLALLDRMKEVNSGTEGLRRFASQSGDYKQIQYILGQAIKYEREHGETYLMPDETYQDMKPIVDEIFELRDQWREGERSISLAPREVLMLVKFLGSQTMNEARDNESNSRFIEFLKGAILRGDVVRQDNSDTFVLTDQTKGRFQKAIEQANSWRKEIFIGKNPQEPNSFVGFNQVFKETEEVINASQYEAARPRSQEQELDWLTEAFVNRKERRTIYLERIFEKGPLAEKAVPFLLKVLADQTEGDALRKEVLKGLDKIFGGLNYPTEAREAFQKILIQILNNPKNSLSLRVEAAKALGKLEPGDKETIEALIAALQNPLPEVVNDHDKDKLYIAAAEALGNIPADAEVAIVREKVNPVLTSVLSENGRVSRYRPEVIKAAALALSSPGLIHYADSKTLAGLNAVLNAPGRKQISQEIHDAVQEAFRTIQRRLGIGNELIVTKNISTAIDDLEGSRYMSRPESKIEAVQIIAGEIRQGRATPEETAQALAGFQKILGNGTGSKKSIELRLAVIDALGSLGEAAAPAVEALIEMLPKNLGNRFFGPAAVEALGKIGPGAHAAVPSLSNLLYKFQERRGAEELIGKIKTALGKIQGEGPINGTGDLAPENLSLLHARSEARSEVNPEVFQSLEKYRNWAKEFLKSFSGEEERSMRKSLHELGGFRLLDKSNTKRGIFVSTPSGTVRNRLEGADISKVGDPFVHLAKIFTKFSDSLNSTQPFLGETAGEKKIKAFQELLDGLIPANGTKQLIFGMLQILAQKSLQERILPSEQEQAEDENPFANLNAPVSDTKTAKAPMVQVSLPHQETSWTKTLVASALIASALFFGWKSLSSLSQTPRAPPPIVARVPIPVKAPQVQQSSKQTDPSSLVTSPSSEKSPTLTAPSAPVKKDLHIEPVPVTKEMPLSSGALVVEKGSAKTVLAQNEMAVSKADEYLSRRLDQWLDKSTIEERHFRFLRPVLMQVNPNKKEMTYKEFQNQKWTPETQVKMKEKLMEAFRLIREYDKELYDRILSDKGVKHIVVIRAHFPGVANQLADKTMIIGVDPFQKEVEARDLAALVSHEGSHLVDAPAFSATLRDHIQEEYRARKATEKLTLALYGKDHPAYLNLRFEIEQVENDEYVWKGDPKKIGLIARWLSAEPEASHQMTKTVEAIRDFTMGELYDVMGIVVKAGKERKEYPEFVSVATKDNKVILEYGIKGTQRTFSAIFDPVNGTIHDNRKQAARSEARKVHSDFGKKSEEFLSGDSSGTKVVQNDENGNGVIRGNDNRPIDAGFGVDPVVPFLANEGEARQFKDSAELLVRKGSDATQSELKGNFTVLGGNKLGSDPIGFRGITGNKPLLLQNGLERAELPTLFEKQPNGRLESSAGSLDSVSATRDGKLGTKTNEGGALLVDEGSKFNTSHSAQNIPQNPASVNSARSEARLAPLPFQLGNGVLSQSVAGALQAFLRALTHPEQITGLSERGASVGSYSFSLTTDHAGEHLAIVVSKSGSELGLIPVQDLSGFQIARAINQLLGIGRDIVKTKPDLRGNDQAIAQEFQELVKLALQESLSSGVSPPTQENLQVAKPARAPPTGPSQQLTLEEALNYYNRLHSINSSGIAAQKQLERMTDEEKLKLAVQMALNISREPTKEEKEAFRGTEIGVRKVSEFPVIGELFKAYGLPDIYAGYVAFTPQALKYMQDHKAISEIGEGLMNDPEIHGPSLLNGNETNYFQRVGSYVYLAEKPELALHEYFHHREGGKTNQPLVERPNREEVNLLEELTAYYGMDLKVGKGKETAYTDVQKRLVLTYAVTPKGNDRAVKAMEAIEKIHEALPPQDVLFILSRARSLDELIELGAKSRSELREEFRPGFTDEELDLAREIGYDSDALAIADLDNQRRERAYLRQDISNPTQEKIQKWANEWANLSVGYLLDKGGARELHLLTNWIEAGKQDSILNVAVSSALQNLKVTPEELQAKIDQLESGQSATKAEPKETQGVARSETREQTVSTLLNPVLKDLSKDLNEKLNDLKNLKDLKNLSGETWKNLQNYLGILVKSYQDGGLGEENKNLLEAALKNIFQNLSNRTFLETLLSKTKTDSGLFTQDATYRGWAEAALAAGKTSTEKGETFKALEKFYRGWDENSNPIKIDGVQGIPTIKPRRLVEIIKNKEYESNPDLLKTLEENRNKFIEKKIEENIKTQKGVETSQRVSNSQIIRTNPAEDGKVLQKSLDDTSISWGPRNSPFDFGDSAVPPEKKTILVTRSETRSEERGLTSLEEIMAAVKRDHPEDMTDKRESALRRALEVLLPLIARVEEEETVLQFKGALTKTEAPGLFQIPKEVILTLQITAATPEGTLSGTESYYFFDGPDDSIYIVRPKGFNSAFDALWNSLGNRWPKDSDALIRETIQAIPKINSIHLPWRDQLVSWDGVRIVPEKSVQELLGEARAAIRTQTQEGVDKLKDLEQQAQNSGFTDLAEKLREQADNLEKLLASSKEKFLQPSQKEDLSLKDLGLVQTPSLASLYNEKVKVEFDILATNEPRELKRLNSRLSELESQIAVRSEARAEEAQRQDIDYYLSDLSETGPWRDLASPIIYSFLKSFPASLIETDDLYHEAVLKLLNLKQRREELKKKQETSGEALPEIKYPKAFLRETLTNHFINMLNSPQYRVTKGRKSDLQKIEDFRKNWEKDQIEVDDEIAKLMRRAEVLPENQRKVFFAVRNELFSGETAPSGINQELYKRVAEKLGNFDDKKLTPAAVRALFWRAKRSLVQEHVKKHGKTVLSDFGLAASSRAEVREIPGNRVEILHVLKEAGYENPRQLFMNATGNKENELSGVGGGAFVFRIPNLKNKGFIEGYVLLYRGGAGEALANLKADFEETKSIENIFPAGNVGQPVLDLGPQTRILLEVKGYPVGIVRKIFDSENEDNNRARKVQWYETHLAAISQWPQDSYDRLAGLVQTLNRDGIMIDPKPSNMLIDTDTKNFNYVDVKKSTSGHATNDAVHILIPLLMTNEAFIIEGEYLKDNPQKDEYLQRWNAYRKDILGKAIQGMINKEIPIEIPAANNFQWNYFFQLAGMDHKRGIKFLNDLLSSAARSEVRSAAAVVENAQAEVWNIAGYQFTPVPKGELDQAAISLADAMKILGRAIFKEREISSGKPVSVHLSKDADQNLIFKLRGKTDSGEIREAEIAADSRGRLVEFRSYKNLDRVANALQALGGIRNVFRGYAEIPRNGSVSVRDVTPENLKDKGIQVVDLTALNKAGEPVTLKLQIQEGAALQILEFSTGERIKGAPKDFTYQTRPHQTAVYAPQAVAAPGAPALVREETDVNLKTVLTQAGESSGEKQSQELIKLNPLTKEEIKKFIPESFPDEISKPLLLTKAQIQNPTSAQVSDFIRALQNDPFVSPSVEGKTPQQVHNELDHLLDIKSRIKTILLYWGQTGHLQKLEIDPKQALKGDFYLAQDRQGIFIATGSLDAFQRQNGKVEVGSFHLLGTRKDKEINLSINSATGTITVYRLPRNESDTSPILDAFKKKLERAERDAYERINLLAETYGPKSEQAAEARKAWLGALEKLAEVQKFNDRLVRDLIGLDAPVQPIVTESGSELKEKNGQPPARAEVRAEGQDIAGLTQQILQSVRANHPELNPQAESALKNALVSLLPVLVKSEKEGIEFQLTKWAAKTEGMGMAQIPVIGLLTLRVAASKGGEILGTESYYFTRGPENSILVVRPEEIAPRFDSLWKSFFEENRWPEGTVRLTSETIQSIPGISSLHLGLWPEDQTKQGVSWTGVQIPAAASTLHELAKRQMEIQLDIDTLTRQLEAGKSSLSPRALALLRKKLAEKSAELSDIESQIQTQVPTSRSEVRAGGKKIEEEMAAKFAVDRSSVVELMNQSKIYADAVQGLGRIEEQKANLGPITEGQKRNPQSVVGRLAAESQDLRSTMTLSLERIDRLVQKLKLSNKLRVEVYSNPQGVVALIQNLLDREKGMPSVRSEARKEEAHSVERIADSGGEETKGHLPSAISHLPSASPRAEVREGKKEDFGDLADTPGLIQDESLRLEGNILKNENGETLAERFRPAGSTYGTERVPENIFVSAENPAHIYKIEKKAGLFKTPSLYKENMLREAKALLELQKSPAAAGVPRLLQMGRLSDGRLWIKMESLANATPLQAKRFSNTEEIFNTFLETAKISAEILKEKISNNDIKPGNILIDENGRVQVIDFDMATLQETAFNENGSNELIPPGFTPWRVPMDPVTHEPAPLRGDKRDIFSLILTLADILGRYAGLEQTAQKYLNMIFVDGEREGWNQRDPKEWPDSMEKLIQILEKDRRGILDGSLPHPSKLIEKNDEQAFIPTKLRDGGAGLEEKKSPTSAVQISGIQRSEIRSGSTPDRPAPLSEQQFKTASQFVLSLLGLETGADEKAGYEALASIVSNHQQSQFKDRFETALAERFKRMEESVAKTNLENLATFFAKNFQASFVQQKLMELGISADAAETTELSNKISNKIAEIVNKDLKGIATQIISRSEEQAMRDVMEVPADLLQNALRQIESAVVSRLRGVESTDRSEVRVSAQVLMKAMGSNPREAIGALVEEMGKNSRGLLNGEIIFRIDSRDLQQKAAKIRVQEIFKQLGVTYKLKEFSDDDVKMSDIALANEAAVAKGQGTVILTPASIPKAFNQAINDSDKIPDQATRQLMNRVIARIAVKMARIQDPKSAASQGLIMELLKEFGIRIGLGNSGTFIVSWDLGALMARIQSEIEGLKAAKKSA